jgi:putative ATP-dependent endonuclease of OLD family
MYLSNLKLWNFRKFGSGSDNIEDDQPSLSLNLTKGLNAIIGENDSGKTAIIDAIKLVLKTHSFEYIRPTDKDFYNTTTRFRIDLTFDDLQPDEAMHFTEWLGWIGTGAEAKPSLRVTYEVKRQGEKIFPSDVKAGIGPDGHPLAAEAREYLKITYLKPLRDAENELIAKRNSRLSQILLGDAAFRGRENDHDLVELFEELTQKVQQYFKGELRLPPTNLGGAETSPMEGKAIKDKIDNYIRLFFGSNHEIDFEFSSNDIKAILEKLALSLKDEHNPGLGTLNRLFMAAELLHLNKENWSGLRLGLVEELEAHLHPQSQLQVIEALQKQQAIQIIITTHSSNLASKLKLENLIICSNGNVFPMGSTYTKLTRPDYLFLEKFLDATKANLFFAKGLILVEGWAEEIILPSIARNLGIDLTERGISIVNIGNLGFAHYSNIFLRQAEPHMKIPVAIITDVDIPCYAKEVHVDPNNKLVKDAHGKTQHQYLKLPASEIQTQYANRMEEIERKSEQSVKYFLSPIWTFEYCLFHSPSLSATFRSIVKDVHSGTNWETDFEQTLARFLLNKQLKKAEIAYRLAQVLDEDNRKFATKEIEERTIAIDPSNQEDTIHYLLAAIKYATTI